jgi:transmembrane sensor
VGSLFKLIFTKLKHKDKIDDIIVSYLNNESTVLEKEILLKWLNEHPSNKNYFDELNTIWLAQRIRQEKDSFDPVAGFMEFTSLISKDIDTKRAPRLTQIMKKMWKYAAVFVISAFLSTLLIYTYQTRDFSRNDLANEIIVPYGSRTQFVLSDGTSVHLNAGSKFSYSNNYGITDRIVQLEGEGYFIVVYNSKNPFIVETSALSVEALGTEFNVKAYSNDNFTEATLIKGSVRVEVREDGTKQTFILKPDEKITYRSDKTVEYFSSEEGSTINMASLDSRLKTGIVNVESIISWRENKWIIEDERLENLALEMERRYNIEIVFESERIKNFRFTGVLKDEPLEQVLNMIKITAPINFSITNRVLTIKENTEFKELYKDLYRD